MGTFVCHGAKMKCSMGDQSGSLSILPDKQVQLDGQNMTNIK